MILWRPSIDVYASANSNNSLKYLTSLWPWPWPLDLQNQVSSFWPQLRHQPKLAEISSSGLYDLDNKFLQSRTHAWTDKLTHGQTAWKHNASNTRVGEQRHQDDVQYGESCCKYGMWVGCFRMSHLMCIFAAALVVCIVLDATNCAFNLHKFFAWFLSYFYVIMN